jgi:hypothetical protein
VRGLGDEAAAIHGRIADPAQVHLAALGTHPLERRRERGQVFRVQPDLDRVVERQQRQRAAHQLADALRIDGQFLLHDVPGHGHGEPLEVALAVLRELRGDHLEVVRGLRHGLQRRRATRVGPLALHARCFPERLVRQRPAADLRGRLRGGAQGRQPARVLHGRGIPDHRAIGHERRGERGPSGGRRERRAHEQQRLPAAGVTG